MRLSSAEIGKVIRVLFCCTTKELVRLSHVNPNASTSSMSYLCSTPAGMRQNHTLERSNPYGL